MRGDPLNLIRVMPAKGQDTMPISQFLAKLMALMGIAIGVGLLINPRACRRVAEEFLDSQTLIYFSGLIGTGGLAIVLTHEIWTADWRVIITLLGWIAFLTAIARIVMPGVAEPVGRFIFETRGMMSAAGAIILTLGLCLSYAGFVA